ncbi:RPL38 [Cordylochernes scorpioides]|uniref:Large ribosomal subunit protein eL38 n=1 Tax=Cordylochernes scorpioides TaxID=51811 RepID=A0ABY6KV16_9ARAC|nr:RPL38 [Cordylochernes scorpioides]
MPQIYTCEFEGIAAKVSALLYLNQQKEYNSGTCLRLPRQKNPWRRGCPLVKRSDPHYTRPAWTTPPCRINHTPGDKSPRLLLAEDVTRLCPPPHRNAVFGACHMAAGTARVHPSFSNFTLMPKQIKGVKDFVYTIKKKHPKEIRIKKNKDNVKLKIRCKRYLHTFVTKKENLEGLKKAFPPQVVIREL